MSGGQPPSAVDAAMNADGGLRPRPGAGARQSLLSRNARPSGLLQRNGLCRFGKKWLTYFRDGARL